MLNPTISQQLRLATDKLSGVTMTPLLEAEILLAHVMQVSRSHLYARPEHILPTEVTTIFGEYIVRRSMREPIAYIIGRKEFWSLTFSVNPSVLIPRPETEELIEFILKLYPDESPLKVADLGTGSGAIALALASERPHWQITATDIEPKALQLAKYNAEQLGLPSLSFYQGNWCDALPCQDFDIIISNPPYLSEKEWQESDLRLTDEPKLALVSGKEGLDAISRIIPMAKKYLKPQGRLFIEHGFSQGQAVRHLFKAAGYKFSNTLIDLSDKERITWGIHA